MDGARKRGNKQYQQKVPELAGRRSHEQGQGEPGQGAQQANGVRGIKFEISPVGHV